MIEPGAVLLLDMSFGMRAFHECQVSVGGVIYSGINQLVSSKLIVVEKVAVGFKYKVAGQNDNSYSSASLWRCLSVGKEVWVSNLDYLASFAFYNINNM